MSERWARWRATVDLDDYEARFRGADAHGEADFVAAYSPSAVLDAGCGTGRVGAELARRGIDVVGVDLDEHLLARARATAPDVAWVAGDLATFRLDRQFPLAVMAGNVLLFCRAEARAAVVARVAAHLTEDGRLVSGFSLETGPGALTLDEYDAMCEAAGLVPAERFATWQRAPFDVVGGYVVAVHSFGRSAA